MTTHPNQSPGDAEADRVLMRFGPAPTILGVLGAVAGGAVMVVYQDVGIAGVLGGAVLGLGAGWLLGIIIAMAFLGE